MSDDLLDSTLEHPSDARPLTVSELTARVRACIESDFPRVWVEGEIGNWSLAGSGHAYFSLKDEGALLGAVMWRTTAQKIGTAFREGDKVEARGRLSVYDKRGQYQLVVDSMRPVGEGLLWKKFQELKEKLEREGLFAPERKRAIPKLPRAVGVVTSPTGAAIRDILSILERRAPGVAVYVWPARVQGTGAAAEIAAGVRLLAASGLVEVLIVGRGGGSLEDLWEFNDERLAREITKSPIPVISAVGHEVDFSISDFVADLRAATPSAAAELVSAEHSRTCSAIRDTMRAAERALDLRMADARQRLRAAMGSRALHEPEARLRLIQQETDEALRRMENALDRRLAAAWHRARASNGALAGHDPALILKKGFAIVRRAKDGHVVTREKDARPGTHLRTELAGGIVRSIVTDDVADLFE